MSDHVLPRLLHNYVGTRACPLRLQYSVVIWTCEPRGRPRSDNHARGTVFYLSLGAFNPEQYAVRYGMPGI